MEQHPVPQQISSYEFRLVGDMTLKQFGKLAGGVVIGLLVYSTNLVFVIKWPLIIGFAGGGAAMAFLPFQERSLDSWLKAFVKSIYAPTLYIWHKKDKTDWLQVKEREEVVEVKKVVVSNKNQKIEDYSASLSSIGSMQPGKVTIDFEEREDVGVPKDKAKQKAKNNEEAQDEESVAVKPEEDTPMQAAPVDKKETENTKRDEELLYRVQPSTAKDLPKREKSDFSMAKEANFAKIPMPKTPSVPNTIAGMVVGYDGKIIEGAIVEIQDEEDNPLRALRTNSLGQFQSATPLGNGKYIISTEKDGVEFDIIKIELTGGVVLPVKIVAKPPIFTSLKEPANALPEIN